MARKPKSNRGQKADGGEIAAEADQCGVNTRSPKASSSTAAEIDPTERLLELWPDWDQPDGTDPDRPVRVFADGIFDMFHFGHAKCLEQAKKLFPHTILVVGVCSDADTLKFKGQTVFTEQERYESVRHCKWADEVVEGSPWVVTPEFLVKHKIDYVAHDALPYGDASGQAAGGDCYAWMKKALRFKETRRTPGVSTSDIILRIVKNYNDYVFRNLKRGYTRKELGVGILKEKQLRAKHQIRNLSRRVREQQMRIYGRGRKMAEQQVQICSRVQKRIAQQTSAQMSKWQHEIGDSARWLQQVQVSADRYMQNMAGNVDNFFRSAPQRLNDELRKVNNSVNKVVTDIVQPLMKPRRSRTSTSTNNTDDSEGGISD
mmetsp:Transcript_22186/g.48704  ORF Transcript_22186/g.48704 Transcript_22186/m.48704 type:complete len:374 (-) Transcript_22186:383-1504(-)|eukprot:CAMPEP_0118935782 /NCGR_PEP_ID=MMETSP1169-20130426/15827_1 /TAXON_ID=36882 /ORGANISM="Pyramimonas obovata, Strain CCMP722" /LENGTH=373 /DNA_ID=CAMNT_0006878845 /DNA_START=87 /DNA_END=1208 /DNA_ORIENTATION=-